jgi:adenine phosphoribosyltransferase
LVDDLLATGGTMRAACDLVEGIGGEVVSCLFVVELRFLAGRKLLAGQQTHALVGID